jgi:glycine cleavage system H protein
MNDKKYSKDHEWILLEESLAVVGITNHAQESLGDVVYIQLPEIGKNINTGEQIGVIESVKAASDLISPVSGEIIDVNKELEKTPQLINNDAENNGWYMKIKLNKIDELNKLMNLEQYKEYINK